MHICFQWFCCNFLSIFLWTIWHDRQESHPIIDSFHIKYSFFFIQLKKRILIPWNVSNRLLLAVINNNIKKETFYFKETLYLQHVLNRYICIFTIAWEWVWYSRRQYEHFCNVFFCNSFPVTPMLWAYVEMHEQFTIRRNSSDRKQLFNIMNSAIFSSYKLFRNVAYDSAELNRKYFILSRISSLFKSNFVCVCLLLYCAMHNNIGIIW